MAAALALRRLPSSDVRRLYFSLAKQVFVRDSSAVPYPASRLVGLLHPEACVELSCVVLVQEALLRQYFSQHRLSEFQDAPRVILPW